jgi:hypothetical protein
MKPNQEARLRELEGMPNRDANEEKELTLLNNLSQKHQEFTDLSGQGADQEELKTAEENLKTAEQELGRHTGEDMEDSEEEENV